PPPPQPQPPTEPSKPSNNQDGGDVSAIEMMLVTSAASGKKPPPPQQPPPTPSPNPTSQQQQQQNGGGNAKRVTLAGGPQSSGKPPLGLAQKLKAAAASGGKANAGFVAESKEAKDKSGMKAGAAAAGGKAESETATTPAAAAAPATPGGGKAAAGKPPGSAPAAETAATPAAVNAPSGGATTDNRKVMGSKDFLSLEDAGGRTAVNQGSRRLSTISQISHFSGGDFSNSANGGLPDNADNDESGQPRKRFHSNDSYIQEQVPVLPVPAAVFVLAMNVLLPGFGTILSGLLYLCVGPKEHRKVQGFFKPVCINFWVGISQLVTVTFLLVGWFWSLAWGVYAVQKALDQRDELRRKRKQEIAEKALNALMGGGVGGGGGDGDGGGGPAGGLISLFKPR
uniref:Protein SPEC3 n=1 Tax=Macrostomum lignano TaxID=282301 RepID=A0A1I8HBX9_9PLAT